MFKEDVIPKEENRTLAVPKEFVKSLLSSAIIHFINYSLNLPAIYSVIPLMILILIFMLFTRGWDHKVRQYAFLIPYVAEYFGFLIYFYNKGKLMPVTACCMTVVLAVWGVVCIECIAKSKKRTAAGFVIFVVIAAIAIVGVCGYYSALAKDQVEKIKNVRVPDEKLGEETDALCQELNSVFYAKRKLKFSLAEVARSGVQTTEEKEAWRELQENLVKSDGKWISTLYKSSETLTRRLENF